jgi:hypothetical protein
MGLRTAALLLAALAGVTTGCAVHWDVDSYQSPGADIPSRETFFWKGGDFATAAMPSPAIAATTEAHVRSSVVAELVRKGYRETATAAGADYVVSYQVSAVSRFVADETPRIGAPSATTVLSPSEIQPPPASTVPREVTVREGAVVMFVDDGASGRMLWRGEVAGETRAGSPEHLSRIIAQMMVEIAKELPARPGVTR